MAMRTATISRKTKETDIKVSVDLDSSKIPNINTSVGFFDHMLNAFAIHSGISLEVDCKGDLEVDCHHTIEDIGIVLGQAINQALGDKSGITRYGNAYIPMDEALGFCTLDISGREFLVFEANFQFSKMGDMDTQMVEEFFRAVANNAKITLHIKSLYGNNDHHIAESLFKAFAHALKMAISPANDGKVLSTKGML